MTETMDALVQRVSKQVPLFGGMCPFLKAIERECTRNSCPLRQTFEWRYCWELSPENLHEMCKLYQQENQP